VNVLWRSLVAHQRYDTLPVGPFDTVMRPPAPDGIDVTDFDRHAEIFEASYLWAKDAIEALVAGGNSAIAAILDTGDSGSSRSCLRTEFQRTAMSG
jgi:NTE family protein